MRSDQPTRVLVVDDQTLFRRAVATLIAGQEDLAVVGEASNGLDAVEQARELSPDLIVMDVEMPVMNGLEAAALILKDLPRTKIVVLTVSHAAEHLAEAIRAGVHGYLVKDMQPEQLFEMLRAVIRNETAVSPVLTAGLVEELRKSVPRNGRNGGPPRTAPLTPREIEILRLVAEGLSNREIGRRLVITEGTVKNHVHSALEKLNLENRIQAAAYIVRQGLDRRSALR